MSSSSTMSRGEIDFEIRRLTVYINLHQTAVQRKAMGLSYTQEDILRSKEVIEYRTRLAWLKKQIKNDSHKAVGKD